MSVNPACGGDASRIRESVKQRYRQVADDAAGHFKYPVGAESLRRLGYDSQVTGRLPAVIVDRFVGVGNPFSIDSPRAGEAVLDVGCGCGLDTFVAGFLVGESGRAVGLDMTPEMLDRARAALPDVGLEQVRFTEGSAESLPFEDGQFDLVISNGVLNLAPDKDAAFGEIFRVLRPGGRFAAADLVVMDSVPEEVLRDVDAWSQ